MKRLAFFVLAVCGSMAQVYTATSLVGTVNGFRPETAEVEIRPDSGGLLIGKFTPGTIAQKIAPGTRDLKNAETIKLTDVERGDRVLVTLEPGSPNVRRIVVMSAGDIARRNETDRLDWQKRGVAGLVSAKSDSRIIVKTRTLTGEAEAVITFDEHTSFKRYAPDSVKFTDAKLSRLSEIEIGDQVRARGEKSGDGLNVQAQEVVFGTFVVKAGAIVAVNPESSEITVKEMGTNRILTILLTAGSQLKQMPGFPGGMAGEPGRGTMPGGAPPAGGQSSDPGAPGRGGPAGGPAGGFDINQMLERMPAVKVEDLKPGSTVVISSTKGAKNDRLTAIMLLSNADMLIRMASMASGGNRGGMGAAGMGSPGMGGMMGGDPGGLSGLGLSGIIQ